MHSQTRDDSVVVFAIAALLQQMCILLLIGFLVSSSVHVMIAISSAENTVHRYAFPSYIRVQKYLHQSSHEFPTHL